jgi:hypothetical protein
MLHQLLTILQIPDNCLVNKKLTKAFFKRNFDLTTLEKNLLDDFDCVKSIDWLASVSPSTANIPAYHDAEYTFEEIEFIALGTTTSQFERNKFRLAELLQKYIPYHVLVFIYADETFMINTCLKRINLSDSNKRVPEKQFYTQALRLNDSNEAVGIFFKSLAFASKDKINLKTFYDSYVQQMIALQTADITGCFTPRNSERTKKDVEYLEQIKKLETEILQLQNIAKKETQLNRKVELNTDFQNKKQQIENLKKLITTE